MLFHVIMTSKLTEGIEGLIVDDVPRRRTGSRSSLDTFGQYSACHILKALL